MSSNNLAPPNGAPVPSHNGDFDCRRFFPFGLSPIPEVPSELASEVSSICTSPTPTELTIYEDDLEELTNRSIMYSGSCSSIKSNKTLTNESSDSSSDSSCEAGEEDSEYSDESDSEESEGDSETEIESNCKSAISQQDYSSQVMTVLHQRSFNLESKSLCGTSEISNADEEGVEREVVIDEGDSSSHLGIETQTIVGGNDSSEEQNQVLDGAVTASEIFRHLQATREKDEVTTELAKILDVLHSTLSSNRDSESSEEDEKSKQKLQVSSESNVKLNSSDPGKPPLPPRKSKSATTGLTSHPRVIAQEIHDRIQELQTPRKRGNPKEEMSILSKILVTLLCSCKSIAATGELRKIIKQFKDAAKIVSEEELGDQVLPKMSTRNYRRSGSSSRQRNVSGNSNNSASEAESLTNTLTPNDSCKSSGTEDEGSVKVPSVTKTVDRAATNSNFKFDVTLDSEQKEEKDHSVSFTITLPPQTNSSSITVAGKKSTQTISLVQEENDEDDEEEDDEDDEEEWEWEEDDDVVKRHEEASTVSKILADMELGAYNSAESMGSPGQVSITSPKITRQPFSVASHNSSSCGGEFYSTDDDDDDDDEKIQKERNPEEGLFTHLEETFKVLNGAYCIITGSKYQDTNVESNNPGSLPELCDPNQIKNNTASGNLLPHNGTHSFEEEMDRLSSQASKLENDFTISPTKNQSPLESESKKISSRPISRAQSRARLRAQSSQSSYNDDGEEDDEWEYYYEEDEVEEKEVIIKAEESKLSESVFKDQEPPKTRIIETIIEKNKYNPSTTNTPHIPPTNSRPDSRKMISRPNSRAGSRPGSRPGSRCQSRAKSRNCTSRMSDLTEADWEWEYYYEGEEDELKRLSPTGTTAPTTRATSPFPIEDENSSLYRKTWGLGNSIKRDDQQAPPSPVINRASLVTPGLRWEDTSDHPVTHDNVVIAEAVEVVTKEELLNPIDEVSVALAAEYLGQKAEDVVAALPPNFIKESSHNHKKKKNHIKKSDSIEDDETSSSKKKKKRKKKKGDGKFLPKLGVKDLASRLESKLFQDQDAGTKMVMSEASARSSILTNSTQKRNKYTTSPRIKCQPPTDSNPVLTDPMDVKGAGRVIELKKYNNNTTTPPPPPPPPPPIPQFVSLNSNQVQVIQGEQSTTVQMRKKKKVVSTPSTKVNRSPTDSEAYGTGSTSSEMIESSGIANEGEIDESTRQARHSRLFRLLQDSDYTDSESEKQTDYPTRISMKGVDDLVNKLESSDIESICSAASASNHSPKLHTSKNRRFMNLNLQTCYDSHPITPSSSELSTPSSPVRRKSGAGIIGLSSAIGGNIVSGASRGSGVWSFLQDEFDSGGGSYMISDDSSYQSQSQSMLSLDGEGTIPDSTIVVSKQPPKYLRHSPKLEMELLELAHLPSAPGLNLKNRHKK